MLYLVIIVLVLLYLLTNEKEGFVEYTSLDIGTNGPTYSSPNAVIDWLGMSDLDYSKAVSKLQGKNQSVTIRNLV